jgi:hypothetical protein
MLAESFARFQYVVTELWFLGLLAVYLDHRRRVTRIKRLDEPDLGSQCQFGGRTYTITSIDLSSHQLTFGLTEKTVSNDHGH